MALAGASGVQVRVKPKPKLTRGPVKFPTVGKGTQGPGRIAIPVPSGSRVAPGKPHVPQAPKPPVPKSPYVSPFASSGTVTGGRIDQGVDYTGKPGAPIGAIGAGKVTQATSQSGWPGGGFIAYVLSGGPQKGKVIYTAEDVQPTVKVGQTVKAGQPIGVFNQGGWIEAGFGGSPTQDFTLANAQGQSGGSVPTGAGWFSTAAGVAYDKLVRALKGPGGQVASRVSGSEPASLSATGGPPAPSVPTTVPAPGAVPLPPSVPSAFAVPTRPRLPAARGVSTTAPRRTVTGRTQPAISPVPTAATPTSATASPVTTLRSLFTGTPDTTGGTPATSSATTAGNRDWLLVIAALALIGWLAWKEWHK